MIHIRRDAKFLCVPSIKEQKDRDRTPYHNGDSYISLTEAHRVKIFKSKYFCDKCVDKHYELLKRMPLVVVTE